MNLITYIILGLFVPDLTGMIGLAGAMPEGAELGVCIGGEAAIGARAPLLYRGLGLAIGLAAVPLVAHIPPVGWLALSGIVVLMHLGQTRSPRDVALTALSLGGALILIKSHTNLGIALTGLSIGQWLGRPRHTKLYEVPIPGNDLLFIGLVSAMAWVCPVKWLMGIEPEEPDVVPDHESIKSCEAFAGGVTLALALCLGKARSGPLHFANVGAYDPLSIMLLMGGATLVTSVLPIAKLPMWVGQAITAAICLHTAPAPLICFMGLGLLMGALDTTGRHHMGVMPYIPLCATALRGS